MIIFYIIIKFIFDVFFGDNIKNFIVKVLDKMVEKFFILGLEGEIKDLKNFYESVKIEVLYVKS